MFIDWQNELKNRINDVSQLPSILGITEEEREFCQQLKSENTLFSGKLPLLLTPYLVNLLCKKAEQAHINTIAYQEYNALRKQFIPSPLETIIYDYELQDPLGEEHHRVLPRLIHQYKNRCLLLSCGNCACYCRHCFRRVYTSRGESFITKEEIEDVCVYLKKHPEVQEILISGGDPLIVSDEKLAFLLEKIRNASPHIILRLGTRTPVFLPSRFTQELVSLLKKSKPLWLIPHINHPAELSQEVQNVLHTLCNNGIPMQSQSVLLKDINDNLSILAKLFNQLTSLGVKPGYLFQGDLAPGTAHLRVPLNKGLELYKQLRHELSGLSLPTYAVDLPGGGGKFNLLEINNPSLITKQKEGWYFRKYNAQKWFYPEEL